MTPKSTTGQTLIFLSTLSLRRATPIRKRQIIPIKQISIHALLAESDQTAYFFERAGYKFLSTLSLRRATLQNQHQRMQKDISIHALLAESDNTIFLFYNAYVNFYPRSPCGERHWTHWPTTRHSNFYPRSPCGERQSKKLRMMKCKLFLSTLSLRRATGGGIR